MSGIIEYVKFFLPKYTVPGTGESLEGKSFSPLVVLRASCAPPPASRRRYVVPDARAPLAQPAPAAGVAAAFRHVPRPIPPKIPPVRTLTPPPLSPSPWPSWPSWPSAASPAPAPAPPPPPPPRRSSRPAASATPSSCRSSSSAPSSSRPRPCRRRRRPRRRSRPPRPPPPPDPEPVLSPEVRAELVARHHCGAVSSPVTRRASRRRILLLPHLRHQIPPSRCSPRCWSCSAARR